jgi:GLPGLI family protein
MIYTSRFLFIFICSILSTSCLGQTIIVEYVFNSKYFIQNDSVNVNKESLTNKLNFELLNSIKYKLLHSEQKSIFLSSDSSPVFLDVENDESFNLKNFKISNFTSITFKDFAKNKTLQREFILDKSFIIDDELNSYNWQLLSDEKVINGFKCKLATSKDAFGIKVFAWFSNDIPIINGPSIYHGLPGLIIQINSEKFSFELISLKFMKRNTQINFEEKGELINQKDFVLLLNKKLQNLNIKY